MIVSRVKVCVVKNSIRGLESRLHVAELQVYLFMDVVVWAIVMDPRSFFDCGKPFFDVKTGWQILIFDFDKSYRLFCCHFVNRSHRNDGISNKPNSINFKRIFIFTDWQNPVLHREVLPCDNCFHSRDCLGFGSVNAKNSRVGPAGPKEFSVEHPWQSDVVSVNCLAGCFAHPVNPRQ